MPGPTMNDAPSPAGSKFASLGPLLLARKGSAKPAMRPQLGALVHPAMENDGNPFDAVSEAQDDLGWNDMGEDATVDDAVFADGTAPSGTDADEDGEHAPTEPEVRRQQEHLLNRIADANLAAFMAAEHAGSPDFEPANVVSLKAKQRRTPSASLAPDDNRRAAFTLRLDGERHLRLRLASTVNGESAQNLVTRALDEFLARMPDIETLAAQVRRPATKA